MDTDPTAIDNYGPFTIVRVSDGEEGEGEFAAMLTAHWATTDQHVNCVGCEYIAEGCKSAAEVRSEIDKLGPPPGYKLELGIDEKRELAAVMVKVLEGAGFGAKPHANCPGRVYVTRKLNKRVQDMGYVELLRDGQRNYNGLDRASKTVRDMIELDAAFHKLLEMMKRADLGRAMRGAA